MGILYRYILFQWFLNCALHCSPVLSYCHCITFFFVWKCFLTVILSVIKSVRWELFLVLLTDTIRDTRISLPNLFERLWKYTNGGAWIEVTERIITTRKLVLPSEPSHGDNNNNNLMVDCIWPHRFMECFTSSPWESFLSTFILLCKILVVQCIVHTCLVQAQIIPIFAPCWIALLK